MLRPSIQRIVVGGTELEIQLDWNRILAVLLEPESGSSTVENATNSLSGTRSLLVKCPFKPLRRRGELRLLLAAAGSQTRRANPYLLKAIARAHRWRERIVAGEVYAKEQLAAEAGLNASYLGRILRLMDLAPELVESALREQAIAELPLKRVLRRLPLEWKRQRSELLCH